MEATNYDYHIFHNWKHVQGHIVKQQFTKQPISAPNEDEAIEIFIQSDAPTAKHIKRDSNGDWRYGSYSIWNTEDKVYAVRSNTP